MMNSLNLTLSEKHFICPPILNESFAGQSSLGGRSLPFKTWNISFQPLLACCISSLKDDFMTWLTQACVLQCRGTAKTLLVTSSQIAQMLSCWLLTLSQFVSNKGNRDNDTCSPIPFAFSLGPITMVYGLWAEEIYAISKPGHQSAFLHSLPCTDLPLFTSGDFKATGWWHC